MALDRLMDAKALRDELGITRHVAEAIMRALPKVQVDGVRKSYVRRADVERYLAERTVAA